MPVTMLQYAALGPRLARDGRPGGPGAGEVIRTSPDRHVKTHLARRLTVAEVDAHRADWAAPAGADAVSHLGAPVLHALGGIAASTNTAPYQLGMTSRITSTLAVARKRPPSE